jgi:flagellar basal-body rod protein FlgB
MIEKLTNHLNLREKSLDAAWTRNEVIAQNIANVDTPGYKKRTVRFEEYLDDVMQSDSFKGNTTDKRHIKINSKEINDIKIHINKEYDNFSTRLDGNNVDIETEMASLAKNEIRYNTLIQSLSGGFAKLKSVIKEGR